MAYLGGKQYMTYVARLWGDTPNAAVSAVAMSLFITLSVSVVEEGTVTVVAPAAK